MPGDIMDAQVYRAVYRLVGPTGSPALPRPYRVSDFDTHPHVAAGVYVVTDRRSRVRYVGSAMRKERGVSSRLREHLRSAEKERAWAYVWFLPFGADVALTQVRLMERLVGERLCPTDNRRLPGLRHAG